MFKRRLGSVQAVEGASCGLVQCEVRRRAVLRAPPMVGHKTVAEGPGLDRSSMKPNGSRLPGSRSAILTAPMGWRERPRLAVYWLASSLRRLVRVGRGRGL
jgi:hypothetical protein